MAESKIATRSFISQLKSSSTSITWTIEGFKRFMGLHPSFILSMDQICCRFQGSLDVVQPGSCFLAYFQGPFLCLQRVPGCADSHNVLVYVTVVVQNSENVTVLTQKSELLSLAVNAEKSFNLGSWDALNASLPEGPLRIQCTIEQLTWDIMQTKKSQAAGEIRNQFLNVDLKKLLESRDNADVKLKLSDGKILSAHKAILSARSPVFNKMFSTPMKESKENAVELVDIGEEALTELLSYIYTGKLDLNGKSVQSLRELVDAADKYQLANMKNLCNEYLPECCNAHNAFDLLKLAKLHGLRDSESLISSFIELNITDIINSDSIAE